jgi:hypothetical protein
MTKLYTLVIALSIAMISCKTASKAYDKGDYEASIDLAIKKLQKDPDDGETKALLMAAYKNAVAVRESKIRSLSTGTNIPYESIYYEYAKLQNVYEKLQPFPYLVNLVHATDYTGFVKTYGEKAAESHFEKGVEQMNKQTKSSYRQAYYEFRSALRFADTHETRDKMDQAYTAAVVNVVLLPVSNQFNPYRYNTSYEIENFQNNLLRDLRSYVGSDFLKIYSEWDAKSRKIEPDQVINLQMGRFDIGRAYDKNQTRTVSKDVVIKEIVYKPDSVVKQYGKVTAQITSTQRTLASEGELFVIISDPVGQVMWTDRIKGTHQWKTSFATYHGDERALSDQDRALVNQNPEITPQEDEIREEIFNRIKTDLQYRLKNYFSRYD